MAMYIDEEYVTNALGLGPVNAIQSIVGIKLAQMIESATALVQAHLRNSGYSTPETTEDITVKEAVLWAVWLQLSKVPEASIPLPATYRMDPRFIAFDGIVSGDVVLTLPLSDIGAVGGAKFSNSDPLSSAGLPQRSSRANLRGY